MKKSIGSALAVAGMVLTTAGLSAQQQPAESKALDAASRALAVESVASVVELNYPWPDTARMIAAHVRRRHAARAYDAISTRADLARALTRDLRANNGDLHLAVADRSSGGASTMAPGGPAHRPTGVDHVEHLDGNVGYLKFSLLPPRTAGAGRSASSFPAELGLAVSVSTLHLYEESSGRGWERTGVLPDILTTSEEALAAALEHARMKR
jgi:hypothetical protein